MSDRLLHLLLLRRLLERLLNDYQHLRRFHGVVRLSLTHASVYVASSDGPPVQHDLMEISGEQHQVQTAC